MASGVPAPKRAQRAQRADPLKIVTKYILREHVAPLVFSLSALTSLLLLNYVAKQLGQLVGKGLSPAVIAEFMGLSVPFTFALTLPMAVLVSTMHAFSRMAAENEITAFKASGFSIRRLMLPVFLAACILTLTMVWFNDRVLPAANHQLQNLTNDIARKKPTFALKEQVINEVTPSRIYLRAATLVRNTNRMLDVTIFDMSDPMRRRTIHAESGLLELSNDGRDLNLTLYNGVSMEISPQEPTRLQRSFFKTDVFKVRGIGNQMERDSIGGAKSDREMTVCELQERVVQSRRMRDSSWLALRKVNIAAAASIKPAKVPVGLGDYYCRMLGMTFVRPLAAAEVAPQAPPQGSVPAQPAQVPVQAPVREPVKGGMPAVVPGSPAGPDSSQRFILKELVRTQMNEAQRIIDGNQVEIEKKFAIAAACMVFVLLGAPIALRFPRGGVGLTIGVSLGVFGLYYLGLTGGETLARRGWLSPFWAMWTANIVLLAIGLWLTARLGSEGTTARGSETSELVLRLRERLGALLRHRRAPAG